ncbi:MAG: cyclic 2,3-diphosphoglycerate synthase [Candidatus Aenigmatarchaeota archaeon]|nr:cyclic 2,3-diphosphoglycerate synthase [Candidatus Aenigmarchaeota archaeon]
MKRIKTIILGAAGRDFHNFNMVYRDNPNYEVVAFTATQIPGIAGRLYPKELAGKLYPKGIPIYPEEKLPELIKKFKVDQVVFAYSDVSHEYVMHRASIALSNGADFVLLGPNSTMLKSSKPVISVTAVRTGSGKSQTTRKIAKILKNRGKRVAVIRHPMPYGHLKKQIVERFATYHDLDKYNTTIEEREEYEPHIDNGIIVYAGVDYEKILRQAEKEADVIIWDGGNNDFSFIKSDLYIVVVDPHRAGHELKYHPGETNLRMADVIVVNKIDSAKKSDIRQVIKNTKSLNPKAKIILAKSVVTVDKPELIEGKKVLVVEDGPTLTHGGMPYGAGTVAAQKYNCEIIDARKYSVGSIKDVYKDYPHLKKELPAMGYSKKQIKELEKTINSAKCQAVIDATPIKLPRIMKINKPVVQVDYELQEVGKLNLEKVIKL